MKTRFYILSMVSAFVLAAGLVFMACDDDEQEDQCAPFANEEKYVYVDARAIVMNGSTPLDSVHVQIQVTYLPCGVDEAEPAQTFTGYTDASGVFFPDDPVNIAMNNDKDRVKFSALSLDHAHNNYAEEYKFYSEMNGAGQETFDLEIDPN